MKKYVFLIISTLIAVTAIIFMGSNFFNQKASVDVITIEPVTINETVSCNGSVVMASSNESIDYSNYMSVYNSLLEIQNRAHDREASVKDGELYVVLEASQSQAAKIANNQEVVIAGAGLTGKEYKGSVAKVDDKARQKLTLSSSRTVVDVVVNVDFENNPDIRPGYSVKGVVTTATKVDSIVIPFEAVKSDADGREYVYKVEDETAIKTYIVTGDELENGFEVLQGLCASEVVTNNSDINDGQKVCLNAK